MGTNYYLHEKACPACKRLEHPIHIGKSSAGWVFALRIRQAEWENELPASWAEWKAKIEDPASVVVNEYGDSVTAEDMVRCITERSHSRGLNRRSVDGRHCVGHGEGTWDLCVGEFS